MTATLTTEPHVGDTLPELVFPPINRTTLALFAGASNDYNQMHIDIDAARAGGMPDVFAHGMLGMAYLGGLLTQWVDQRRLRGFNARFVGVTQLNHQLTCSGRVTEIVDIDGERRAKLEVQLRNQHGEVKILGEATVAL
jgi:acyl dehydratase